MTATDERNTGDRHHSRPRGLIIAAPGSGSGKTLVTLALLRALARRGIAVGGGKSGPDYIDPRFHAAAAGRESFNLDAWAMPPERIRALAAASGRAGCDLLLIEGAMGLFDGAPPSGRGATADLARILALPVVLVIDAAHMAHSVAALVAGFAQHDSAVQVAGVILNRSGSSRHEKMLSTALKPLGIPIIGCLRRDPSLTLPARHLGLVQAGEHHDLDSFLDAAAERVEAALDLDRLTACAAPLPAPPPASGRSMAPPASRIAIARDNAFAFIYPHLLDDWRSGGAEIAFFSPLADEPPPDEAQMIFLPGGYPELHAGRLAAADRFRRSVRRHAARGTLIYGECGGYMVLGAGLTDARGRRHEMLGLLALETSYQNRRLHLGYRHLEGSAPPFTGPWRGHEFHYATTLRARGDPLFAARSAEGSPLPPMGLRDGSVCGSFAHVIESA